MLPADWHRILLTAPSERRAVNGSAGHPGSQAYRPFDRMKGTVMPNHTYKKIDLVGSSSSSITDAIESAIARAHRTTRNLEWFEVEQVRGSIFEGRSPSIRW
jgi:hypothetical protein